MVRVWEGRWGRGFFSPSVVVVRVLLMMCGFDFALDETRSCFFFLSFFFFFFSALPLPLALALFFPMQRDLYHVCKAESKCGDALDLV